MKSVAVALVLVASASAQFQCPATFKSIDGQCIKLASYPDECKTPANCNKWFGGAAQCDPANPTDCGWTYLAAVNFCKQYGPNFGLVKINNQYQNNHFNRLDGEGAWNLAWIGASCKSIKGAAGSNIAAWVWDYDQSAVLDGFNNFDFGVDSSTCTAGQSLNLGGTAYNGKWRAGSDQGRLGDAVCAENFNTDAPTPAPNVKLTCQATWTLFPDPDAPTAPGRLGPVKCYKMLSNIHGQTREFTWYEANVECQAAGGQLAKIEDVQTNEFVNSALGGGAYGIQWIGGKCVSLNGGWRFRWTKDNELVAAGYTNFPIGGSGGEQEINPCNAKTSDNPAGSSDQCVSSGSVGYNYQWRTGACSGKLGDAICERVPIGGTDDTPGSGSNKKKGKGGVVAAGVIVPLLLVGGAAFAVNYLKKGQGNMGLSNKFISTSTYEADDGTEFSTSQAGGAASL